MKKCLVCGKKIPLGRLEAIPETATCVKCSTEIAKVGITIWDKTSGSLIIVDAPEAERYRNLVHYDGCSTRF